MKIAVVAPGGVFKKSCADAVLDFVGPAYGARVQLVFHPQCFLTNGHFAGDDSARASAFCEVANDPSYDAVWFARGGYGTSRILPDLLLRLTDAAKDKIYMGYSDAGILCAALYRAGVGRVFHGPMPCDIAYEGGAVALRRALDFMLDGAVSALEPSVETEGPIVALNLSCFNALCATPYMPDLSGHVLMIEEVGEYLYHIDRMLGHAVQSGALQGVKGVRLGRLSAIPLNDPAFGMTAEGCVRFWCDKAAIPFLGSADIGHDQANKVVPFGVVCMCG